MVTPVSVITLAPTPPVTLIAVIVAHNVAGSAGTAFSTTTLPPVSQEMVIASASSPDTASTPSVTSALTSALAMPGNASAAAAATAAIGIELFHFDDTGPPGALGSVQGLVRRRIYSPRAIAPPRPIAQPTRMSFLLTNSSAPKRPSSRPNPERLTPPKGSSALSAPTALTNTMPASIWSATRSACSGSVVRT